MKPIVLIHIKDRAELCDYHLFGDVDFYIVDETAPDDRVYHFTTPSTVEKIKEILGESEVGSKEDDRHEALAWRLLGKKPEIVK